MDGWTGLDMEVVGAWSFVRLIRATGEFCIGD